MMGKDEDTGELKNFTCIGGKHAINLRGDAEDPKVIDTRFQGVLDGRGHTISIHCNRYSRKGFGYSWNIGLVGYLGGGVDRVTKNAKDCKIDFAKENPEVAKAYYEALMKYYGCGTTEEKKPVEDTESEK